MLKGEVVSPLSDNHSFLWIRLLVLMKFMDGKIAHKPLEMIEGCSYAQGPIPYETKMYKSSLYLALTFFFRPSFPSS